MNNMNENHNPKNDELQAFFNAAKSGNVGVLSDLLDRGVDIESRDPSGKTALYLSVGSNQFDAVRLLLEKGANVNTQDDAGKSPLYLAAKKCLPNLISLLLEAGADINLKTKKGQSILDFQSLRIGKSLTACEVFTLLRDAQRKEIMQANVCTLQEEVIETYNGILRFAHAVVDGDIVAVKFLIGKGANVNKIVSGGSDETLLHIAVDRNHPDIVAALLEAGADVNAKNGSGETPLHRAALNSSASVPLLIGAGADVDARDEILDTPLHYAAESNSLETIEALINAGATVDLPGYGGRTALFEAVFHQNSGALNLLIQCGANVNYRINLSDSKSNGETPIHAAALYANLEIMTILIDAGAEIEVESVRGKKAMDYAIQEQKPDLVMFLLKCGAEVPDLADYLGQKNSWAKAELWYRNIKKSDHPKSAANHLERLCQAIRQGEDEKLRTMIHQRRTNPNAFDKHGYTPLHWALLEGNVKVVETLLNIGADLELPTTKGSPPLILSTWRFMLNNKRTEKGLPMEREATLDAFRLLLDRGAKVDAVNKAGLSLLHIAARNGEIGIMQRLLDYGANLEFLDENNRTALFHAIEADRDSYLAVKFLVDCGAKLNIRDREHGRTPLHHAALCRMNKIVNFLLDAGADRTLKDDKGKTALNYVRK